MAEHGMGHMLGAFVQSLSGKNPTPAGGAAAAAAVACGVGLFLKVGRITQAGLEAPEWKRTEAVLEVLSLRALGAVQADCDAFDAVLAAKRRGEDARAEWVLATQSPLDLVHVATQALVAFAPFREHVKRSLTADCNAAAELVSAGIAISLENARGNLPAVPESGDRERLERALQDATREAAEVLGCFEKVLRLRST
tara:strand:+ start:1252 stop:1842 length:591 start_codon:yes stop_codon:yes gene_type:complete